MPRKTLNEFAKIELCIPCAKQFPFSEKVVDKGDLPDPDGIRCQTIGDYHRKKVEFQDALIGGLNPDQKSIYGTLVVSIMDLAARTAEQNGGDKSDMLYDILMSEAWSAVAGINSKTGPFNPLKSSFKTWVEGRWVKYHIVDTFWKIRNHIHEVSLEAPLGFSNNQNENKSTLADLIRDPKARTPEENENMKKRTFSFQDDDALFLAKYWKNPEWPCPHCRRSLIEKS